MAKNGFRVMDSDIHVIEPRDVWVRYMEPAFRDQAPRFSPIDGSNFEGWQFAVSHLSGMKRGIEIALMLASSVAWLLPTVSLGGWWLAVFLLSQSLAGLYLALAIAPNHRGATEYYGELKVERGDMAGAKKMLAELDRQCAFGCAEAETLRRWISEGHDPGA